VTPPVNHYKLLGGDLLKHNVLIKHMETDKDHIHASHCLI